MQRLQHAPTRGRRPGPVRRASLLATSLASLVACEARYVDVGGSAVAIGDTAELPPGSSVLVVITNPVVNGFHATGVPAEMGAGREGIAVDPEPGGAAATVDGVAVVDVPVGTIDLRTGPAALALEVMGERALIDAPIAFDGERAAYFAGAPIRYPLGGPAVIEVDPDTSVMELSRALKTDDAVMVLTPGVYAADLMIKGNNVVVFGAGWGDLEVVLDGSVFVKSDGARIRGVDITGKLELKGDDAGISFSRVRGPASITGRGGVFLHNTFCAAPSVSTTAATWLDNSGVAPLELPAGACDG